MTFNMALPLIALSKRILILGGLKLTLVQTIFIKNCNADIVVRSSCPKTCQNQI